MPFSDDEILINFIKENNYSTFNDAYEFVKLLIEMHAEINLRDKEGSTP